MKKPKYLWLARHKECSGVYALCRRKPKLMKGWWQESFYEFCRITFESLFPSLKLEQGYCQKLKIVNLKTGMKLVKVGKPWKG